jgi:hypothetical protein
MGTEPDLRAPADVETEIRQTRQFTPKEALARLAGPGAMKGASPVSPDQQAEIAIGIWLRANVADPSGALNTVLHRHLRGSQALVANPDRPLVVLAGHFERLLKSDRLLEEIVREADVEWARAMDERPYFERGGSAPHPDDPYTVESVRKAITAALAQLSA